MAENVVYEDTPFAEYLTGKLKFFFEFYDHSLNIYV